MGRVSVVFALFALCVLAPAASASQDPLPNWPDLLPPGPVSATTQPGPVPHCRKVTMRCIDNNVQRLQRLVDQFGCDHRGVFATTYLTLTQVFRDTLRRDPHYFKDRRYLIIEDTLFLNYYTTMLGDYAQGRTVPPAWAVAMHNDATTDDNAAQDMLAGINAHVQRDMPFVVAQLGLRMRNGSSRKPDHDKMNQILNDAYQPVVDAVARRYDPFVSISNASWDPADDIVGLEMVKEWREAVWRNAERLVNAKSDAQRQQVQASIETNAAAWEHMIGDFTAPPGYRNYRDAYCRAGGASGPTGPPVQSPLSPAGGNAPTP